MNAEPNDPTTPIPPKSNARRIFAGVLAGLLALFIGYSCYIGFHESEAQETILLGQSRLAAGSPASWRFLVRNRTNGRPIAKAKIGLKLRNDREVIALGTFTTGKDGTIADAVALPDLAAGDYSLVIEVRSRLGRDQIERKVQIANPAQIFLTTDKPLYQPGQIIHLRGLVCNSRTHQPLAAQPVMFEISDAKGNKVFKEEVAASPFGIVSTDFLLASELNQGHFDIRASSGFAAAERRVEVKSYVMPKFKATLTTEKSFYHPGEVVNGWVQAAYFFGKPAAGASVELNAKAKAGQTVAVAEAKGMTDDSGKVSFQFLLPYNLADLLQRNESSSIDLIAEVRDTGQHVEETTLTLPLSRNELELTVFPEAGNVVPGVTNLFYIVAAYPDGRPASCDVAVNGQVFQTGAEGVCVINALPGENGFALDVKAWDNEGRSARLLFKPDDIRVAPALLLRPGRAVLEAGQNLKLTVLSRRRPETAFIDVIRDRQTAMTASMPLKDNRGELNVPLPIELAGVVKINAYLIDENGDRHGCSRFIFVNPANGLQVRARADKPVYRPGETAKVELQVTNAKGESFPTALGICAVDESLLWLHSNSSGLVQSLLESENDLLTSQNHTRAFNSFDRLLANPLLAQAWLSTLQPPARQPVLDELVTREYLPQGLLERVRRWKGTPYYDRMRGDPAYQQVFQILEKQDGDYDLIEATGPAKKWGVEQRRTRYFNALKQIIGAGIGCFCFASPLLLLVLAMKRGETRIIEVLVVIALLAILAGLMLPALAKAKAKAASVSARSDLKQVELAVAMAEADGLKPKPESTPRTAPTRVRSYFPETLFWRPEVITDEQGKAVIEIPLADSITTWRTSFDAINSHGQIGSTELPVHVFQDFFIDLDLPASLTLNDEISIPVTCYNYLDSPQEIRVTLNPAGWFESPQTNVQSTKLAPNEVKTLHFPVRVTRVGQHRVLISATGAKISDAISREIQVRPSGHRIEHLENGTLQTTLEYSCPIPEEAISSASSLRVKLFPTRFSEVVEGLDSIFQEPHGCFEQTSSTTYPNVLTLDYLKTMGLLKPEIAVKARGYINEGYQRLLTFEVAGGGFEWFGHSPANVCLTAYGVLEFSDMARVHSVDEKVINRTAQWLDSQQNVDGTWNSGRALHSWSQNPAIVTAYVAWALAESGIQSPSLEKALNYLRSHRQELDSSYSQALAANALLSHDNSDVIGRDMAARLQQNVRRSDEAKLFWTSTGTSMTWSHGASLEVETTALCTMALMKAGIGSHIVKGALQWLSAQKAPNGTWHTTQATILAMRALIRGSAVALGQDFTSEISVWLNKRRIEVLQINRQNSDLTRSVDLTAHLLPGNNDLELRQQPPGELPCQISFVHWLPGAAPAAVGKTRATAPLRVDLEYDRTTLAVNESLHSRGSVHNKSGQNLSMVMVDLGIPPGFEVDLSPFKAMQFEGQIAKFESIGGRVVLYLRELPADKLFAFHYALTAKYPLRVEIPRASAYEYYTPENKSFSQFAEIEVK